MAIVEYFAFESRNKNEIALQNFRNLASYGLQRFIYDALNYHPLDKWQYHNDRVSILADAAPAGYFIIFREITGLVVDLIAANLTVNHKTIPDISVGKLWATHWKENNLATQYGDRIPCKHSYPSYYPQAESNPQEIFAYPDAALPDFRRWFREQYLPTKFPAYILRKADMLQGGKHEAMQIAQLYQPQQITVK